MSRKRAIRDDDELYGEDLGSDDSNSIETEEVHDGDEIDSKSRRNVADKGKAILVSDDDEDADDEGQVITVSDDDEDDWDNDEEEVEEEEEADTSDETTSIDSTPAIVKERMKMKQVKEETRRNERMIIMKLKEDMRRNVHQEEEEEVESSMRRGPPGRFGVPPKPKRRRVKGEDVDDFDMASDDLEWKKWELKLVEEQKLWRQERYFGTDKDKKQQVALECHPTPDELVYPLLPFQMEFLAWSLKQELSDYRGGILADEMGMGKTIQAISLFLAGREENHGHARHAEEVPEFGEPPIKINCTLVICPVVAVEQWRSEIERFTYPDSVKVLVYHGTSIKKVTDVEELEKYDIILSTYSVLEHAFRQVIPDKRRCKHCQKPYTEKGLKRHLKFHCGPFANKVNTNTQAKGKSKSNQGKGKGKKEEAKENPKKPVSEEELEKHLEKACGEAEKVSGTGSSLLHSVKWVRVILDEAHTIKERASNTAKAAFALNSCYRWLLSGTPLQNRVGELYSLVRFLRIFPYSLYFCTKCNCKRLEFVTEERCDKCDHSSRNHFCWWNKMIANPIAKEGFKFGGEKAMEVLKRKVLDKILTRRTKKERAADLSIPPKTIYVRKDVLDENEDGFYEALYKQSQSVFNTYVKKGTVLNNYAHIFDLLTKLRQAVDHPYLITFARPTCAMCIKVCDDPVEGKCGDSFCKTCAGQLGKLEKCPRCGEAFEVDFKERNSRFKKGSIIQRLDLPDFRSSTKLEALKQEINLMLLKDSSAKALVFSQFTSMLDLIDYSLGLAGHKVARLDGSMGLAQRVKMINMFRNEPDCRIFLMSLKAGGVALNLTVASNIFIMDPWWNPAVENQAMDRIHRIGQCKPIRVTRFVIEGSVEERILKLQEKKGHVFDGTIGGSKDALTKLSEKELKFLFM